MAIQIANPLVTQKVEQLARQLGMGKTAVVERAIDRLADDRKMGVDVAARMRALLTQIDRVPDREDAFDATSWDEHGLPHG